MTDRIAPGLLAALEHFSEVRTGQTTGHYFVFQREGYHEAWSLEEACRQAKDLLEGDDLYRAKFEYLRKRMLQIGLGAIFSQIMEGKL